MKMNLSPSKNEVFRTTMSKHGPNGTVITMTSGKAVRETKPLGPQTNIDVLTILRHLVDFGSHLGAHWILNGVPKSIFLKNKNGKKKRREMRSKKRVGKNMIC